MTVKETSVRWPWFVSLSLVELVVELEFFLAAIFVAATEVGLRQVIMGIGIVRIVAGGRLKLGKGFLIAMHVMQEDAELKVRLR